MIHLICIWTTVSLLKKGNCSLALFRGLSLFTSLFCTAIFFASSLLQLHGCSGFPLLSLFLIVAPIQPGGGHYGPPYQTFFNRILAMKDVTLKLLDFYQNLIGYIIINFALSIVVSRDLRMPFFGDRSQRKS